MLEMLRLTFLLLLANDKTHSIFILSVELICFFYTRYKVKLETSVDTVFAGFIVFMSCVALANYFFFLPPQADSLYLWKIRHDMNAT